MSQTFPNLDGLMRLSRTEGVDIRPALLRVLTDLFVQDPAHSREQERQYVELALRLLPVVDSQTRSAVTRKLRGYAALPAPLREYVGPPLAGLDKPVPDAAAQEAQATSRQPPEAAAAQKQQPIENDVSASAAVPAEAFSTGELFLQAGSAERRHLIARLDDSSGGAPIPSAAPALAVIDRLERAALQRNAREFARELQAALGISSRIAWRIVQDEFGEPLLIAARFLGMPAETLVRITLFLNPAVGESVERVFALARLYERIGPASATAITASWRDASRALERAQYQPLHAAETSGSKAARDLRNAGSWSGTRSEPRTSPADRSGRQSTT
jgi:hypothetical protein